LLATTGFFFSEDSVNQSSERVGVFIDGSNLLGSLSRISVGYPNLQRLITHLIGKNPLVDACFYGAPPVNAPQGTKQINYYPHWMRFVAAHRNTPGLKFYYGYREKDGKEKAVDVALAVDLMRGACKRTLDRAIVVGGDGDHQYAVEEAAKEIVQLSVIVVERQKYSGMKRTGVPIQELTRAELLSFGICAPGNLAQTPI
jgi:uncharacterized LabA/DUF88 family protein